MYMRRIEVIFSPKIMLFGVYKKLTFASHAREIAGCVSRKLSSLRRLPNLLDLEGCGILYQSQVRPLIVYCTMIWSKCSNTNFGQLNVIQRRAKHLIDTQTPPGSSCLRGPLRQNVVFFIGEKLSLGSG